MPSPFSAIICPFCFREISKGSIEYRCVNQRCPGSMEPDHQYSQYMRYGMDQPMGHVFKPSGLRLFGGSSGVSCDLCHGSAHAICPHCHNPLPVSTLEGSNNIISIVGTRGSGKSHYIAVLIDELRRRVGHSMNAGVTHFTASGSGGYDAYDLYRETKYEPLYKDQHRLEQTRSDGGSSEREKDKIPLIYMWQYVNPPRGKKRYFTLSFLDAAGEDLQDHEMIATVASYLQHSKGIIFLVDPLQIPSVRDQLEVVSDMDLSSSVGGGMDSSGEEGGELSKVLANVTTLIRNSRGIKPGQAIDIPVAVTFSKLDALLPLATNAVTLRQPSPHCQMGKFVVGDQQAVDAELRAFLEDWGEGAFVTDVQGNFKDASFFAVSSLGLGNSPDSSGKIHRPSPHRVEDPLLWLMSQLDLIKKG